MEKIILKVTEKDRMRLRELAKQQYEISQLPVMREREERWYRHNSCQGSCRGDYPLVVMEIKYCIDDYLDLECETEFARAVEKELLTQLVNHTLVDDDKVIPGYFTVYWDMDIRTFDLDMEEKRVIDNRGKSVGYTTIHHLENLEESFCKIGKTVRRADKEYTYRYKERVEEIFGDILPVKIKMPPSVNWMVSPSKKAIYLMGLESMMLAPYDCPERYQQLYGMLVDDVLETFQWMNREGLLCLNNGNDYAGAGSYGFTGELPSGQYLKTGEIELKDLWVNLNSQETLSISPDMYGAFYWPHYKRLAEQFGLVYYGCCEPTNPIWKDYLSTLDNLRKVSVSPWADDELMGEYLRGSKIIYSKKPSPNYLALDTPLNAEHYREHIKKSVLAARGCETEIIARDVYALYGDRHKLGQGVQIIREVLEKYW
ncbi:hypothetical protein GKG47_19480 [Lactonifactor sp. BIOML-A3]|uniref:hypothetical protein n=1 Tax=unclassified Lactonifactor TaxID=2636670 RepID=UPI0012B0165B|nr:MULTISPECIES: hypothetical protein [unclassified Lactonifactor]MSA03593.1 hypothetical protein [Lactonifactor sp. BIOML-A5]MSA10094.1 hypothetical protein [Lactonifactor sp. BIOML-A4]MSA14600.1 hypothetical protein [Lactonifactor sp. BIOML-A3]MSA19022.1 hypothetical protein [Lactonifactor sp. BIOML-A2]MSA39740.1 hypothetical protein [Lactonifactor sp. BIOML-A1]